MRKVKETIGYLREALKRPGQTDVSFGYRDVKFFIRFLKPVWKLFSVSIVLTVIMTGLGSVLPLSSKVLIDFVVMKKGFEKFEYLISSLGLENYITQLRYFLESINLVVFALLIIGIIIGLTGMIQRYIMFRLQQELTFNIQSALFDHLLRFPLGFFRTSQVGYLSSRVSDDVSSLHIFMSQTISEMMPGIFRLFFGIAIVLLLSTKLSLILLFILPVNIFINYYFAVRLRSASLDELEDSSKVSKDIQEVISGIDTVKAYSAEQRESGRVFGKMRSLIRTRKKRITISLLSDYSARGSQLTATLLIMWFGVGEISKGTLTVGDYVAFTSYVIYLSGSINSLSMVHVTLQPVLASLWRLFELFNTVPETKEGGAVKPENVRGEIVFKDVFFYYEEEKPVLRDISFAAHPGEIIAFVGPSGAGKTTLVNLLLKFYSPQTGSVSMDGYDLNETDTSWLRKQIGVVSQDIFLFNDTIENNIKYSKPLAVREDVIRAAEKAGIHDDIQMFTDGYDTLVGERGVKLSAGQRQRISIARAFLKDSAVLVFDEPASALDPETETVLKKSIKRLSAGKTIFIIAHRLSTIDIADRIFVLDKGEIVGTGTHEELIRKKGLYHRLFHDRERLLDNINSE
ncbi:MAG: ABC transporter ATP-binding protein [Nitrospirota bacterium]